jgi:hypothetical protein
MSELVQRFQDASQRFPNVITACIVGANNPADLRQFREREFLPAEPPYPPSEQPVLLWEATVASSPQHIHLYCGPKAKLMAIREGRLRYAEAWELWQSLADQTLESLGSAPPFTDLDRARLLGRLLHKLKPQDGQVRVVNGWPCAYLPQAERWAVRLPCLFRLLTRMLSDGDSPTGSVTSPAPNQNPRSEGETAGPYAELLRFARAELKGKERAVIEAVCWAGGTLPLPKLAKAEGVDWIDWQTAFQSLQVRLNPKLRKVGWRIVRQNNAAHLVKLR